MKPVIIVALILGVSAHGAPSDVPRGKTQDVKAEIREYKDPETGARVRRLTGDGSSNVHLYFTSTSFLGNDAERMVFASNRSGSWQYHRLDIRDARLTRLTDGKELSPFTACLDPAGRLFYFDGNDLRAVDVRTLEDRRLYRVPEGNKPHLPTCTADGRYVAFAYTEKRALSTETGRIYSTMAETYYQHPSSVVMRIDTRSGEAVAVWGERMWISHVLIHPTRPNVIVFCHEGGSHVRQRMWVVDLDEKQGRQARPLYPQKAGEFCVHEYFTRQGEIGVQYSLSSNGKLEQFNCFLRPDGTWIRQYLLPGQRPGHIQSNSDNSLVVGDGGYLNADDKEGGSYMSLIRHVNGRAEVRRLCKHGSSWKTQASHPHPIFSPDDKWVLFNSDAEGSDNIFMAEIASLGK